jgi:hypothetical protein
VPSDRDDSAADCDAAASRFVAALGAVMSAAGYPVEMAHAVNPDFIGRHAESFPLAKLVARAPSGTVDPDDGMAEIERIRCLDRRFPVRTGPS